VGGTCVLPPLKPANSNLLDIEQWTPSNAGSWLSPSKFLLGDFDGNGKADLAYLFIACNGCSDPYYPNNAYLVEVGADLYLSCDDGAVPCPSGVPGSQASGAFVHEPTTVLQTTATIVGNYLDECSGNILGLGSDCNLVTGQKVQWHAGDFNGDGKTDIVLAYAQGGGMNTWVGLSSGAAGNTTFNPVTNWPTANGAGGWVEPSTFVVGDFNGDGLDDLAYVFSDPNNSKIDIDVHASTGSSFNRTRWATGMGNWVNGGQFVASDFNGDGLTDIGFAFDDAGNISFDAYLSTNGGFVQQRWATRQGGWVNGQITSVPGTFGRRDKVRGASMVSQNFTPTVPGLGLGGAGLGDFVYAFDDNGQISFDGHLSNESFFVAPPSSGQFTLRRYATQQGQYPNSVQFVGGDFNGDSIGDVADAYECNGNKICIDVHAGTCQGPLADNGQCCWAESNICNGACCWGTCSNSPSAVNGCCEYGQTCPPPPPPPNP
jgi:hypothetical protein